MAYIINKSDGTVLTSLEDGTLNVNTSLGLIGRNYTGYGEIQNENFVFLLENFSNPNPPSRPIKGQTWFDSTNSRLNVYDGQIWIPVGSAVVSSSAPQGIEGAFWVKSTTDQLFVYSGNRWNLIGPEAVEGFQTTRAESRIVKDIFDVDHAVIVTLVDGVIVAIESKDEFIIRTTPEFEKFSTIASGITIRNDLGFAVSAALKGNADTATRFQTARTINGIVYDGTNNITITASTTGSLIRGDYIIGSNFDGSATGTWSVDATADNIIGKVVARDSSGDFSANKITADEFIGLHRGNVSVELGTSNFDRIVCNSIEGVTFAGNAFSATRLQPGRNINGVLFNGTQDITVTANATTLTGNSLATNVVNSSLQSVGVLNSLAVTDFGLTVGGGSQIRLSIESNIPTLRDLNSRGIRLAIADVSQPASTSYLQMITRADSTSAGEPSGPALVPHANNVFNLGVPNLKFNNVYGNVFQGTASKAQYADLAEKYQADKDYAPGTVVMFGGDFEITLADAATTRVAGVISANPAYLMNSELASANAVTVALQGRVPVLVTGKIKKGDMLISAGRGFATSVEDPKIGSVIGKSLEDFEGNEGTIQMVVGRL